MEKRKFTVDQKLAILKEASENGVTVTLEKHGIFPATYYQWKKKLDTMGVEGFNHGMTPEQLKRIRELEKENQFLKEIIIQKELEGKMKDELLKKRYALEKKKEIVTRYILQGIRRDNALKIANISKHQYYYQPKFGKRGRSISKTTKGLSGNIENEVLVKDIERIQEDPDTNYGYIKTTYALKIRGYQINKKKVYRLMKTNGLLKSKNKMTSKNYAKYRKVLPEKPLEILEMDIKFVWIEQYKKHAAILTILDTFTRHALHHYVGYSIKKHTVKQCWEHIIINHLQGYHKAGQKINIEIRNDNDPRFSAKLIQEYFSENFINQVFTHPYTPQENGHVESFHSILSEHLNRYIFWSIEELQQNLVLFYEKYNNIRLHSSIAYLSPRIFWDLWNKDLIEKITDYKQRKTKFKLKIPYDEINQYTGNIEPEDCSLHNNIPHRNGAPYLNNQEMVSAESSHNIRFKKSPSVVPCIANL